MDVPTPILPFNTVFAGTVSVPTVNVSVTSNVPFNTVLAASSVVPTVNLSVTSNVPFICATPSIPTTAADSPVAAAAATPTVNVPFICAVPVVLFVGPTVKLVSIVVSPETSNVPSISNVDCGSSVPIPTLPLLSIIILKFSVELSVPLPV